MTEQEIKEFILSRLHDGDDLERIKAASRNMTREEMNVTAFGHPGNGVTYSMYLDRCQAQRDKIKEARAFIQSL